MIHSSFFCSLQLDPAFATIGIRFSRMPFLLITVIVIRKTLYLLQIGSMGCGHTFFDFISNCGSTLKVNALLSPAIPYEWQITDKFNNTYSGISIADEQGFISIDVTDLPDGFFTPWSGTFVLKIKDPNSCGFNDFKIAQFVESIQFDVKGGTRIKESLGCDFDCNAGDAANSNAIFTFTNQSNVVIPWTSLLKSIYGNAVTVKVFHLTAPDTYQEANVVVDMVGGPYDLSEIDIDNGGPATGYVLIS